MGMIGGGGNAMIGPVHLRAALMENDIELVCGCFSRNYQTSLETGRKWHVPDDRIYHDYKEMMERDLRGPTMEFMLRRVHRRARTLRENHEVSAASKEILRLVQQAQGIVVDKESGVDNARVEEIASRRGLRDRRRVR